LFKLEDFWVAENKAATKIVKDMHLNNLVSLPSWADTKLGLLKRPKVSFLETPASTGSVDIMGATINWAPITTTLNLGGQYTAITKAVKFGNRIYIRIYEGTDLGVGGSKCSVPNFHLRVLRDLLVIAKHQSGQRLLDSINRAPSVNNSAAGSILIKFADGLASTSQLDSITGGDPGNHPAFDGTPRKSSGNVYVQYNPAMAGLPIPKGDDNPVFGRGQWGNPAEKPTDVTLFHELVHADDCINGVFDAGTIQRGTTTVKLSEARCVGLDAFRAAPYSENAYRAEGGLVERDYYSDAAKEKAVPLNPIVPTRSQVALLSWLGTHVPGVDEATEGQVISRLYDDPILERATFQTITDVSGLRNKVKPVDQALKTLETHIKEVKKRFPEGKIRDFTNSDCTQFRDDLQRIADACETYLGLTSRQTSGRIPGVSSLQLAACRQLALFSLRGGQIRLTQGPYLGVLNNKNIRDTDGTSQFGLAIDAQRDRQDLEWLIQQGIDYNYRHNGLRPIDWARMSGRIVPEQVLAAQRGAKSELPDSITLQARNYVDCLVTGTYVDPSLGYNVRQIYQHLWDSNAGLFRPILRVAAHAMAAGPRLAAIAANNPATHPIPLRVYLYPGGKSTCHAANHVVTVTRYSSEAASEGGLIHELTHFVTQFLFNNDTMPFAKTTGTTDGQDYIVALATDIQRARAPSLMMALTPFLPDPVVTEDGTTKNVLAGLTQNTNADVITGTNNQKFVFTLFRRLDGYLVGNLFRGVPMPILQEGIVSPTQALHCYGDRNDALAHAPNLTKYFEERFLPELSRWANEKELPNNPRGRRGSFLNRTDDTPTVVRPRRLSLF